MLTSMNVGFLFLHFACSNEVVEKNQPPTPPVFSVKPAYPNGLDSVEVVLEEESVDPNNHKLVYKYNWYKDGVRQGHITGPILPFFETSYGETWEVEAYMTEVCICQPIYKSKSFHFSFTIENTPPYMTDVQIEPLSPRSNERLSVITEYIDEEGDDVEFFYTWFVNNIPVLCCVDEIPPDMTKKGERWTVVIHPSDDEEGLPLLHQVTIRNSPPDILDVEAEIEIVEEEPIITEQGTIDQSQICVELNVYSFDYDNDAIRYSTNWKRDEEVLYIGELQKVCFSEGGFDAHVDIIAYDGEESSDIFELHIEIPEE